MGVWGVPEATPAVTETVSQAVVVRWRGEFDELALEHADFPAISM